MFNITFLFYEKAYTFYSNNFGDFIVILVLSIIAIFIPIIISLIYRNKDKSKIYFSLIISSLIGILLIIITLILDPNIGGAIFILFSALLVFSIEAYIKETDTKEGYKELIAFIIGSYQLIDVELTLIIKEFDPDNQEKHPLDKIPEIEEYIKKNSLKLKLEHSHIEDMNLILFVSRKINLIIGEYNKLVSKDQLSKLDKANLEKHEYNGFINSCSLLIHIRKCMYCSLKTKKNSELAEKFKNIESELSKLSTHDSTDKYKKIIYRKENKELLKL